MYVFTYTNGKYTGIDSEFEEISFARNEIAGVYPFCGYPHTSGVIVKLFSGVEHRFWINKDSDFRANYDFLLVD